MTARDLFGGQGGFSVATGLVHGLTSRLRNAWRSMPGVTRGAVLLLGLLCCLALLAPLVSLHDPSQQQLLMRLKPPALAGGDWAFPLGTDHLGRDVYSRLLAALATTLAIAGLGVTVGLIAGLIVGLISGLAGGRLDGFFMLLVDAQASIPLTLLALTAVALVGTDPIVLVLIVGISDFDKYARVVRAEALVVKRRTFVEAARALGASPLRLALRHLVPHVASPLIVLATINLSSVLVLESALSFLGVGVQPPHTSLGAMLGEARNYLITNWSLAAVPAATIVVLTMTVAFIGDWLRDRLDPKLEP